MDFLMTKSSLIGHLKRSILIDNCAEWPQKNTVILTTTAGETGMWLGHFMCKNNTCAWYKKDTAACWAFGHYFIHENFQSIHQNKLPILSTTIEINHIW